MKLDSKYFDSIRVRSSEAAPPKPETKPGCQWAACDQPGTHRAPMGRGREGRYFNFCLAHVQAYNKTYNYFDGMSDTDVEAFQKDAATGHRPTWKVGENASAPGVDRDMDVRKLRGRFTRGNRFAMFEEDEEAPKPATPHRTVGNMARKSLRMLNLDDAADKVAIKQRFKELVKRHHPDVNGGDKRSEERLREIIQAYNYLKQAGFC
jgi:DnaJ domain